jgi:hypothetical protein
LRPFPGPERQLLEYRIPSQRARSGVRRRRGVYITGEFFVGPLIALIGWGFAQLSGADDPEPPP